MLFTILLTLFLSGIIQLLISHTEKCLSLLLYLSKLSLLKKYIPKFNTLMEYYYSQKKASSLPNLMGSIYSSENLCKNNPFDKLMVPDTSSNVPKVKTFQELLKEYEEKNSTKVIFIDHQKSNGFQNISFLESQETLTMKDSKKFVDIMRDIKDDQDITLIINSPGGSLTAAEVIIHSLVSHKGKITTFIPYYSMSAGTLVALASNEIYMDKNAYCGPIDPQLCWFSATDIIKYCKNYSESTGMIGEIAKLFCGQAEASIKRISDIIEHINNKVGCYDTEKVSQELLHGKYNHDKPLFVENITDILPNVKVGIPDNLLELYGNFRSF